MNTGTGLSIVATTAPIATNAKYITERNCDKKMKTYKGFDKRSDGWYVTDVASGMRIPKKYDTRMKALAALNAELLGKVDKAVENDTYKAVVKALSEFKTNSEVA